MSNSNVVELNSETLFYIKHADEIVGIGDSAGIEFIRHSNGGTRIYSDGCGVIKNHALKNMCIAWLALNYPDALNFDPDEHDPVMGE